jgi:uncharacterized protein YgiM (DUF1202 family)
MKRIASVLLILTSCCLVAGGALFTSEPATIIHGVSLRGDPSTKNPPIGHLNKHSTVTLLAKKPKAGFYHVETSDGTKGWVGIKYLSVEEPANQPPSGTPTPTPTSTPTSSPTSTPGSTSDADLLNQLFAAHTKAVGQPLMVNNQQVCGPQGKSTDPNIQALNENKNRTDKPASYITVNWDQIKNLPPDRVNDLQGAAVSVVGFLSHKVNVEGAESTNCELTLPNEVDWHIYLTKSPSQAISQAVIVEATPRVRPQHKWTTDMLTPLVNSQTPVRVSGWLLYDVEHVSVIGKERATVWEVHPITKIEVQKNGQWVDLDGN